MTYCESRNKTPYDWRDAINAGINGEFAKLTGDPAPNVRILALESMKKLSVNWTYCACGNQSAQIERDQDGIPKDFIFMQFGMLFGTAIYGENWEGALRILDKIEKYGAELAG